MPLPKMADLLSMLRAAVAEYGGDHKISELPTGPLPDSGYDRTEPGIIGASKQALVIRETETGLQLSLVTKDGTPDVHQTEARKMYARKNRIIAEWGSYSAISTQQNARNGIDPTDTPIATTTPEHNDNGG